MFEKLLSLLPYNPSLGHQLAFYGKRMREEASIRRTGMIFIVLAFLIQFFAVIAPPVSTVADDSSNNLLKNGITSAADAKAKCDNNTQNYQDIMHNYGINCVDFTNATVVTLNSKDVNGTLYSMGRNHECAGDTQVNVPNAGAFYFRKLSCFDTGTNVKNGSSYQALKITAGQTCHAGSICRTYYVLFGCGNLVSSGIPTAVVQKCAYDNSIAADSADCKVCPYNPNIAIHDANCAPSCQYNAGILSTSKDCHPPLCPTNASIYNNNPACQPICPTNASILINNPNCKAICPTNASILIDNPQCGSTPPPPTCTVPGKTTLPANSPNCYVNCPFDNAIPTSSPQCYEVCPYNNAIPKSSNQCFQPCPYNSAINITDTNACKPCDKSTTTTDVASCVTLSKSAKNDTTGQANADGTTAHAGDVITYTIYAKNEGKADYKDFVFTENLNDVLVYATVTDTHGGSFSGAAGYISWPKQTIAAGATATQQITVTVKNPIPQTPADPVDPGRFDLTMTNTYGNTITIKLPGSVAKTIENNTTPTATLVNTGPGTSLFIGAAIVVIAGYFFGRARLLATESVIALRENETTGSL